jgi:hypothetical protein
MAGPDTAPDLEEDPPGDTIEGATIGADKGMAGLDGVPVAVRRAGIVTDFLHLS